MSKLRDACTGLAESRAEMERHEEFSSEWREHDDAHYAHGGALLDILGLPGCPNLDDLARPIAEALDAERAQALSEALSIIEAAAEKADTGGDADEWFFIQLLEDAREAVAALRDATRQPAQKESER